MARHIQSRRVQDVINKYIDIVFGNAVSETCRGGVPAIFPPAGTAGEVAEDLGGLEDVTHNDLKCATTEELLVEVHPGTVVDVTHDQEVSLCIQPVIDSPPDREGLGQKLAPAAFALTLKSNWVDRREYPLGLRVNKKNVELGTALRHLDLSFQRWAIVLVEFLYSIFISVLLKGLVEGWVFLAPAPAGDVRNLQFR